MSDELPTIDQSRTDLLLQFILVTAAQQEDWNSRQLGPIHLLKYAYLADLAHAERHAGTTFTGATWRFLHFGPWQAEIFERIEPALGAIHAAVKRIPSKYEGDFLRYSLAREDVGKVAERAARELPLGVHGAVQKEVREFGADTASLLRHTYLTFPMIHAAPGEALSLAPERAAIDPAPFTIGALSKSQQRRRGEALKSLKERVRQRLAQQAPKQRATPEPRYDEIFAAGAEWLDSLAGESIQAVKGDVAVALEVWKSPQRTEPDVP